MRSIRGRQPAAIAGWVVLIALTTGCTNSNDASGGTPVTDIQAKSTSLPRASESTEQTTATAAPLPTDIARLDDNDDRLIWSLRERLVNTCMHSAGFDYAEAAFPEGGSGDSTEPLLPPADLVAEYGYLWRSKGSPPALATPPTTVDEPTQQAQTTCLAQAWDTMQPDRYVAAQSQLDQSYGQLRARLLQSDEYIAAMDRWRSCLEDLGYASPRDDRGMQVLAEQAGFDTARGIEIAVHDFGCQRESKRAEVLESLLSTATETWHDENLGLFEEVDAAKSEYVQRCTELWSQLD